MLLYIYYKIKSIINFNSNEKNRSIIQSKHNHPNPIILLQAQRNPSITKGYQNIIHLFANKQSLSF